MNILIYSGLVIFLDQLTKIVVRIFFMTHHEPVLIIGNLIRFTYIENPGMAFGIRLGNRTFFTVLATLVSLIILIYLFRAKGDKFWARFSLALILGGAVGNLIDRIAYGQVVDFIDIGIKETLRWPVFNVADIAVSVGMIILVTIVLFEKSKNRDFAESDDGEEVRDCRSSS